MFGLRKKAPFPPFLHAEDCKIVKADPSVEVEWSEEERGFWVATCVCKREYHRDPVVDDRVRLDPRDPSTSRHLGQCEHRDTTDPALLRLLLRVKDGSGSDDYWWVECTSCEAGWQVPHYAVESVRVTTNPLPFRHRSALGVASHRATSRGAPPGRPGAQEERGCTSPGSYSHRPGESSHRRRPPAPNSWPCSS
jgi:hypothetical protein